MKLQLLRRCVVFLAAAAILISPNRIFSCGPYAVVTQFHLPARPDSKPDFARGKLGVILPTLRREYLLVAYRALSGAPLSADELKNCAACGATPPGPDNPDAAAKAWIDARAKLAPPAESVSSSATLPFATYGVYSNCLADAFQNAVRTLNDRIARFGKDSPDIREWIHGQDQVFSNCEGKLQLVPARLDTGANSLLRADREYQIAAAHFYQGKYDDAHEEFTRIAADRQSPWSAIAPYLAARSLIRKATMNLTHESPEYKAALTQAETELQAVIADPQRAAFHSAARGTLGFVEYRLHPDQRSRELADRLTKGGSNPDFAQDLLDYLWLLRDGNADDDDDLTAWVQAVHRPEYESAPPDPHLYAQALEGWHEKKNMPWLVATLLAAPGGAPETEELLAAIRRVPASSPAYFTTRYHMARLLLAQDRSVAARTLLDEVLASPALKDLPSSRNLFLEEREHAARTFDEFLKFAQRQPVAVGYDYGDERDLENDNTSPIAGPLFSGTTAATLNRTLPLKDLALAVSGDQLAPRPRRLVAIAAWVRAALLGAPEADALASRVAVLDPTLRDEMQSYRSTDSGAAKRFAAVLVILRHPGMRPFVDAGVGRYSYEGEDQLSQIDSLRDNWWCGAHIGASNLHADELHLTPPNVANVTDAVPFPAFEPAEERAAASREWKQLSQIGTAPNYLAAEVVHWAKAHPGDPRNPEALHLAVRSTRYGCTDQQTTDFSKSAFEFLHSHYAASPWAKKTPYYF